ncbi:dirigent protein 22-like [Typha angustifolia]|uniref:dirigent protein 22-like n=1 Tax=Typha angustifolia TaxID=59011 RepID=UPI003C301959
MHQTKSTVSSNSSMASSSSKNFTPFLLLLLLLLLTASVSFSAAIKEKSTHLHLYIHEIFTGPSATAITVVKSPLNNSSFGSIGILDDVLREGSDPNSKFLGRFQGFIADAGKEKSAFLSAFSFVFSEGMYNGSTLTIMGRAQLGGVIERSIVGGTGKFRMARGYSLMKILGRPTPVTVIFEVDLYVIHY